MAEVDIKEGMKIQTVTLPETPVVTTLESSDIIAVGSGDKMKHITYSNFTAPYQSGIDNATTSTTPSNGVNTYNVSFPGTYTNFLDSNGNPIVVSSDDLNEGIAQLRKIDGSWILKIIPVTVANVYKNVDSSNEIPIDANVILAPGDYINNKTSIASYTLSGRISTVDGTFTSQADRPASDFIDITGYTHILHNHVLVNSQSGTSFYDESEVFIWGIANTGASDGSTWQTIRIPEGAKYVRYCSTNVATNKIYGYVNVAVGDDQIALINEAGEVRHFTAITDAIRYANAEDQRDVAIAYKAGIYKVLEDVQDVRLFTPGFVLYSTGAFTSSALYTVSGFVDVTGYTHLVLSGAQSGSSAGICFYNASQTFVSGTQSTAPDNSTPAEFAIPSGAKYVRVSIQNASTNKYFALLNKVNVGDNQLAFIENGQVQIYNGGSGSSGVTGNELIADLPVSDGTDISVGDAYIDGTTGGVKVKLA